MTFVQKISDAYREYARKRADRKLVRQMERELPGMLLEMDKMVADLARVPHSLADIMAEAKKYNHVIIMPAPEAAPVVQPAPPPFDTDACTILQNPMSVPRQPIRVRRNFP